MKIIKKYDKKNDVKKTLYLKAYLLLRPLSLS